MIKVGGDFSSLQNIPGGHHNPPCYQHQHLHSSSGSGTRTALDTPRTRSQSSDTRLYWRVAGEMEGGGSSEGGDSGDPGGRRDISCNLALSDFSQLSFLAKGAMCKCFLANSHPRIPGPVVLKMAIENGPREAERGLNSELSLLQNLTHPNLTMVLGAGQTPKGRTFVVMEYLDRGTLRARMDAARGGLGFWPGVRHAVELASVMAYLHDDAMPGMCILHRDLKPDNLGFRGNVMKLVDLGLAKVIKHSEAGVDEFYRMSGEVGSLRYMAPEVASQYPYNEKADVHSFGVVMWELVTGWLPYAGLSPEMFMFQAVQHGQRPLMQFGWDPDFKRLLASCWAEDPRDRPGFAYIHETLEALLVEKGGAAATAAADTVGGATMSSCCGPSSASSSSRSSGSGGGLLSRMFSGRKKGKAVPPSGGGGGGGGGRG
ncbi:unnamed protein product [Ectocarpus sp. CCAP 1310/34]|nr:unnamed protein product [Ectocarpus sp. CCAP 1310/34]